MAALEPPDAAGPPPAEQDPGSVVQQAVATLLASGLPPHGSLEALADLAAEGIGLQQGRPASYVISKYAIMEAARAVGLGAGAATLDTTGFTLAQIQDTLGDIQKKVDILLDSPLQEALHYCRKAFDDRQFDDTEEMIRHLRKVEERAVTAFVNAKVLENLGKAATAKHLTILAEVLIKSYRKNDKKIIPYGFLERKTKENIASIVEDHLSELLKMNTNMKIAWYTRDKEGEARARQNTVDQVLTPCYRPHRMRAGTTKSSGPKGRPHLVSYTPPWSVSGGADKMVGNPDLTIKLSPRLPIIVQVLSVNRLHDDNYG
jgi:hypothetical protein